MSPVSQWVAHLAAVVLMAGVAEMLMPPGRLQGYARAVLGLIVLLTILNPLLTVLHQGVSWSLPDAVVPPPVAATDEATLTREVFQQMLAERAVSDAEAVAGVATATASVQLREGSGAAPPGVAGIAIRVRASPGADTGSLPARVAARVAGDLGLNPALVHVRVGG